MSSAANAWPEGDDFNEELFSLTKPSSSKINSIADHAMKLHRNYKLVVHSIEKFVRKSTRSTRLLGLYVIDALLRRSRAKFLTSDKDVFSNRLSTNMMLTFAKLIEVRHEELERVGKILAGWKTKAYFSSDLQEEMEAILDSAKENTNADEDDDEDRNRDRGESPVPPTGDVSPNEEKSSSSSSSRPSHHSSSSSSSRVSSSSHSRDPRAAAAAAAAARDPRRSAGSSAAPVPPTGDSLSALAQLQTFLQPNPPPAQPYAASFQPPAAAPAAALAVPSLPLPPPPVAAAAAAPPPPAEMSWDYDDEDDEEESEEARLEKLRIKMEDEKIRMEQVAAASAATAAAAAAAAASTPTHAGLNTPTNAFPFPPPSGFPFPPPPPSQPGMHHTPSYERRDLDEQRRRDGDRRRSRSRSRSPRRDDMPPRRDDMRGGHGGGGGGHRVDKSNMDPAINFILLPEKYQTNPALVKTLSVTLLINHASMESLGIDQNSMKAALRERYSPFGPIDGINCKDAMSFVRFQSRTHASIAKQATAVGELFGAQARVGWAKSTYMDKEVFDPMSGEGALPVGHKGLAASVQEPDLEKDADFANSRTGGGTGARRPPNERGGGGRERRFDGNSAPQQPHFNQPSPASAHHPSGMQPPQQHWPQPPMSMPPQQSQPPAPQPQQQYPRDPNNPHGRPPASAAVYQPQQQLQQPPPQPYFQR